MQVILKNVDKAFLPVIESLKAVMPALTIETDEETYSPKLIKSLKKDEAEFKKELKSGKLKIFDSIKDLRAELDV